ncbi:unnamed protein product [Meloidogyne enterolobii]|uniref:Uncharacterized protein n=1 Tax=Meloidogyne enterolobii TaxID=390850 RepID=A0ACB0ZA40_MELEN
MWLNFVKIKNKWKEIDGDYSKCCDKNCINTDEPVGYCIKGNGFGNLISDENIKYINCLEGKEGEFDITSVIPHALCFV